MNHMSMDAPKGISYKDYGQWVLDHHAGPIRQAEFLNAVIGIWYAVFAGIFVLAAYIVIRSYIHPRYRKGMRKGDPDDAYFREGSKIPPLGWWVVGPFYFGAMAFFIGCGLHHWHIAFDTLPSGYSMCWYPGQLALAWLQAIGAPLSGVAAFSIIQTFRKNLKKTTARDLFDDRRFSDRKQDTSDK